MPQQVSTVVENNFTKGLITESTGLNFPENAATECDNVTFSLVGDVTRRLGFNVEENGTFHTFDRTNRAISNYKWNNVGGDGLTQIVVEQVGPTIFFYKSSAATVGSALSTTLLTSTVDISSFVAAGGTFDATAECNYSDGNGYLFIYHPSCDPVYCSYVSDVITGNKITVKIRDFTGIAEPGVADNLRPAALTTEHNYNLINQGWVAGNPWAGVSTSVVVVGLGSKTFTVLSGLSASLGDQVTVFVNHPTFSGLPAGPIMSGNVTAYAGTSMTINVTSGATAYFGTSGNDWSIIPRDTAYISSWHTAIGNYPSNADVWWYFKDSTDAFSPGTTLNNVSLSAGKAPRGHFVLDAFSQQRTVISGLPSITDVVTTARPRTGTWFQGRVWYTGVDSSQPASGDAAYYSWTESLYFSQVIIDNSSFGNCYQTNDPTSEKLFDLLPTDGGVITIQGCGSIFKLFPIQNGLLVFASNGIWFITGSQGIGFTANDYTITKISSVQSISGTSFVDVQGLPYFWNEEGIYTVQPAKGGGLEVDPITVGTILSFYESIPTSSKKYARAAYHPIDYVIQWIYKDTEATDVTSRYEFNKILNYNNYNKAFYPYTLPQTSSTMRVNGIIYVTGPGGSTSPDPVFKYIASYFETGVCRLSFAEEWDTSYRDWVNRGTTNYVSYFITGYKLRGQAIKQFQPQYVQVYSRVDGENDSGYKIQGVWNYALSGNSGKFSGIQKIDLNNATNFKTLFRRHRIRGSGYVLQFKIISQDGKPFDIQGWAVLDTTNTGT